MNGKEAIIDYIRTMLLQGEDELPLAPGDNLLERAPIDSMGVVQLVAFLEKQFGVKIRASEVTIKNFKSVDAMHALIERKRAAIALFEQEPEEPFQR